MALAYTKIRQGVNVYGKRFVEADVTFDSSYPTGGEAVSLASIGLKRVDEVEIIFKAHPDTAATVTTATHGRQIVPVTTSPAAPLLKVYTSNNTEASNTSDQSQIVARLRFIGA